MQDTSARHTEHPRNGVHQSILVALATTSALTISLTAAQDTSAASKPETAAILIPKHCKLRQLTW